MVKRSRPTSKQQVRGTFPYISGTDSKLSIAFRWRILLRLSRCYENQDNCFSPSWAQMAVAAGFRLRQLEVEGGKDSGKKHTD